jgi:Domain of unknown function (DUF3332)
LLARAGGRLDDGGMSKRLAAAALALSLALTAAGCYGSYGASRKLNAWNGDVSHNKVARSAVHLALWIVPVYPLAFVGDFLIFNNVEFLTGKNPID